MFADAIFCGWSRELFPDYDDHLNFEQCRKALEGYGEEVKGDEMERLATRVGGAVRYAIRRGCFFKTAEGFFGICPGSARAGDVVVVGLGVDSPLVLRPVTCEGKSCYLVVGAAYLPGAMHAESLFGPIPVGWNVTVV